MNSKYLQVFAALSFYLTGISIAFSQSGPEFLTCTDSILRLCVEDEGVRLPDNNQIYLGEDHPDAASCKVHVTQKKEVHINCGDTLRYEVLLFLNDTSQAIILTPLTNTVVDSNGNAELIFDTALCPDSLIQLSGIPYAQVCNEKYRFVWIVSDSCGQETSCTSYLQFYDCGKPTLSIPSSPFTMHIPVGCQLNMYAEDFYIGGLDDCSLGDYFEFSFNADWHNPDTVIICPEAFGVELPWEIWIADEGFDLNCDGQINWTERNRSLLPVSVVFTDNGSCDCWMETGITLEGRVKLESEVGIKDVLVNIYSPWHVFPTYVTESDGKYKYINIEVQGEIEISARKNDYHKNGVSTLDLVKIQKHLLGKDTLESPYLLIAADANNSQNVSAIDMVELRKLILGIYTEFPANKSWRFVRKDYVFQQPDDPWSDWMAWANGDAETIIINDNSDHLDLDFIGIKIGDVNNTVIPNATNVLPRNTYPKSELFADQQIYKPGDILHIPIRLSKSQTISGCQFTINASGMEFLDLLPGSIQLGVENFALFGDKATISWFDENNLNVSAGDVLFTVLARTKEGGNPSQSLTINSEITEAELYLENEETYIPQLVIHDPNNEGTLHLMSVAPNPWKDEATVNFFLPEADQVTFTLFDVSGREVYAHSTFLNGGNHQYQLNASDFSARGMMFFEINTSKEKSFQKMIVLE
jgi:hypothetical protein